MPPNPSTPEARRRIASEILDADAVELELAATALFLAIEGIAKPWDETARRKPDKAAAGRLEQAKQLYERLRKIQTLKSLPRIKR